MLTTVALVGPVFMWPLALAIPASATRLALTGRIAPRLRAATPLRRLRKVKRAWESTQSLHSMFRAMIEVAVEEAKSQAVPGEEASATPA